MDDEARPITESLYRSIMRIIRKVDTLSGTGVTNMPEAICITIPQAPPALLRGGNNPTGTLIPVSLTGDHATPATYGGDASTAATYTYKNPVNLLTGAEIKKADGTSATGLAPAWARPIGKTTIATKGLVYVNSSGDPVLFECDEVPATGERSCP